MRTRARAGLSVAALAAALLPAALPVDDAHAGARPGVVSQGPLSARDFDRMRRGGVQTLRFLLRWQAVEAEQGVYDWSSIDPIAARAARAEIDLLPLVFGSPPWVAAPESHPPLDTDGDMQAWRGFLTALVDRYGREGSFWAQTADPQPIVRWQIWNEPNFDFYWHPRPAPDEYAELLAISADAILERDPAAKVIMAGVAPVAAGMRWTRFLRRLYQTPGFARDADTVALHPYSPTIADLVDQIGKARRIMEAYGDRRKRLAITELGWSSGAQRAALVVGPTRQAALLGESFERVLRTPKWRISDLQWYAWQDSKRVERACVFCERAGLFDRRGRAKPAWRAYRRVNR